MAEETKQVLHEVEEFDGSGSGGRWFSDHPHPHESDNAEDSDDDDETTGLTRSRSARHKSAPSIHPDDLPGVTRERSRSLRRASTTLDDYAEQSFLYSTGIVLKKRVTALFVQLCELKSYIQLNKTGFGKVLKKFDKTLHKEMRAGYLERHVLPEYPFRNETLHDVEDKIGKMECAYSAIATQGDLESAKKELRAHLREHVVWERNTVWRDMIGLERRAEAARIGRSLLGTENTSTLLQGDDDKLPEMREFATPFGRISLPLWLANSAMVWLVAIIAIFFIVLYIPILEKAEQQNCLALLVFVSLLWATEVSARLLLRNSWTTMLTSAGHPPLRHVPDDPLPLRGPPRPALRDRAVHAPRCQGRGLVHLLGHVDARHHAAPRRLHPRGSAV